MQLGDNATITVDIKSIVQGPDNSATVRFSTITRYNNGTTIGPANYIATLAYRYVGAPMLEKDRRIDALGFQITSYRVDPEVVGEDVPVTNTGAVSAPVAPSAPATAATSTVPSLVAGPASSAPAPASPAPQR